MLLASRDDGWRAADEASIVLLTAAPMGAELHPGGGARPLNVLFLCTGNSARSIMAEAILRREGAGRFNAFSAGSHPTGRVNIHAIETLQKNHFRVDHLRSKSWGEFETPEAPPLDVVITVCDNAAKESCPVWPGQPISAHWGVADPAAVDGSEHDKREAFATACRVLMTRIGLLTSLAIDQLDRTSLQNQLREIGHVGASS
jgi:arsenate reductase